MWTLNGMDSGTSQNSTMPSNKQIMLPAKGAGWDAPLRYAPHI